MFYHDEIVWSILEWDSTWACDSLNSWLKSKSGFIDMVFSLIVKQWRPWSKLFNSVMVHVACLLVYWTFQGGVSFCFCYLYFTFIFIMLSCQFVAALWSSAGKVLTSGLFCVWCFLKFLSLSFSYGVSDQVWYLIVSIPDFCLLLYFGTATELGIFCQ